MCGLTHKDYDEKRRSTESYRLKYNEYAREYRKTHKRNPEDAKRYRQSESYKALMSQPRKRVSQSMSIKINKVLKSGKEGRSWQDITGYTVDELMEHLEKQFDDKMTWDNRGSYWHVDHIKPISSFDFVSASDIGFKECWSLKNLRPLEAVENMRKGKSVDWVR